MSNAELVAELSKIKEMMEGGMSHFVKPPLLTKIIAALSQQAEPDGDISRVYQICNRYESGYGHGIKRDGLDLSKTPHSDAELGEAYQIGYEAGSEKFDASPQPAPTAELTDEQMGKAWDEANDKYRGTVTHWRILFNEGCRAVIAADRALREPKHDARVRDETIEECVKVCAKRGRLANIAANKIKNFNSEDRVIERARETEASLCAIDIRALKGAK